MGVGAGRGEETTVVRRAGRARGSAGRSGRIGRRGDTATTTVVVLVVVGVLAACAPLPPSPAGPAVVPPDRPVALSGPAALVNPFIGTAPADVATPVPGGRTGATFPGATVPFGALQWSPDTPNAEHPAGYGWADTTIDGFSLTHFSGAGCGNGGLVRFIPSVEVPTPTAGSFSHDRERARPGSYEVELDSGVSVALAADTRTGIGRFTAPTDASPVITIDNTPRVYGGLPVLAVGRISAVDDRTIEGEAVGGQFCSTPTQHRMWFRIELSRPFEVVAQDPLGRLSVRFAPSTDPVVARVGVSWVDVAGARRNLAAEQPGWSYPDERDAALARWNALLGRLSVEGGTETDRRVFTTALYRSLLHPNVSSDVDGRYRGFDGWVHSVAPGRVHLANISGWDIYRSQVQLLAMVVPEVARDLAESMLDDARQCGGGFPKWTVMNTETSVMVGDPGAAIVTALDAFGSGAADTDAVLEVLRRSALDPDTHCGWQPLRPGLRSYLDRGFMPSPGPSITDPVIDWILQRTLQLMPASDTLEFASADAAIARYAARHGDPTLAAATRRSAGFWRNLFDPSVGFVRPRLIDGSFASPFDPASPSGFVEGNAAQYTWMVPHDMAGLVAALGGREAARERLDELFTEVNAGLDQPYFYIGNEPQFTVPWAYLWTGTPDRTATVVRRIAAEAFGDGPDGLPGNDDLGATSSWLVWTMIGLFPLVPGTDVLGIHTPLFADVRLAVPGRPSVQISTDGVGPFTERLSVDGADHPQAWIRAADLLDGANLDFETATAPGVWATAPDLEPPSLSTEPG